MKKLIFIICCIFISSIIGNSLNYEEKIIIKNYWAKNELGLKKTIASSPYEDGYETYLQSF